MPQANSNMCARRTRRMARERQIHTTISNVDAELATSRRMNKSVLVLEMLAREEGASIAQLGTATGWQPHTVRAVLSGLRKRGQTIFSIRMDGGPRIYCLDAA